MTLLPKHPFSRRVAMLWILAWLATLAVMLLQPGLYDGDRNALATLVPLYFLSLPLGHAGVLASIQIRTELYLAGVTPGILPEGLFVWIALGVLGYAQWFLVLPLLARACHRLLRRLFSRGAPENRSAR